MADQSPSLSSNSNQPSGLEPELSGIRKDLYHRIKRLHISIRDDGQLVQATCSLLHELDWPILRIIRLPRARSLDEITFYALVPLDAEKTGYLESVIAALRTHQPRLMYSCPKLLKNQQYLLEIIEQEERTALATWRVDRYPVPHIAVDEAIRNPRDDIYCNDEPLIIDE